MKKLILLFILFCATQLNAQTITLRDGSTMDPIADAVITDGSNSVSTDKSGKADLSSLSKTDTISISHPAYGRTRMLVPTADKQIFLQGRLVKLDEVVLSANRSPESKDKVPYMIETIDRRTVEFANQPTTAEMLINTGQVFVQKSQQGGGSPVLRGLEANKVLLVVDGIRMNNAIYRGGHLQDIITIDQNMLEKTEVLFGPNSTVYGSDALGGVIHLYTKNAQFSNDDKTLVKVNTFGRFASVNNEATGHVDFNIGLKNLAFLTNVTYSMFGDLHSGGNRLNGFDTMFKRNYYIDRIGGKDTILRNADWTLQKFSGYKQLDFMQRINYKQSDNVVHGLNFQYSNTGNVYRYDRLTDYKSGKLRFAEWYYGPQLRMLGAYHLDVSTKTAISDHIRVTLGYQKIQQSRYTREYKKNFLVGSVDDLNIISLNLDARKKINDRNELKYGVEINYNDVKSSGSQKNIVVDTVGKSPAKYPDGGSKMMNQALYLSHSFEIEKGIFLVEGLRFTNTSLQSKFVDTTFFRLPFKEARQNNMALTGNFGIVVNTEDKWKFSLMGSSGFRAPNVDDMGKVFETPNNTVTVPNPDLKPEYAYNMELGISKITNDRYKWEFNAWYTFLENAMVLKPFKFNGKDSALYNGTMQPTVALQNADHGYIYGMTGGVLFDLTNSLSFKSNLTYTYGRYIDWSNDKVMPLDHIPPVFGQTDVNYRKGKFESNFFVRYNGKKIKADYRLGSEDNEKYAPASGMPAWFTVNLRLGYSITRNIKITAACENITDNHYRYFASGISAPGRNFIVSLRGRF